MSFKDGKDYLYLIWKSEKSRKQYIVGMLSKNGQYEFEYGNEVSEAIADGFTPLISFPDISNVYKNDALFPVFLSRLPDKKRRDIASILKKYGMNEYEPYDLLKRSGARLPIDNLEFIDPILNLEEPFNRTFYLAGARHYIGCNGNDCANAVEVVRGDEVVLKHEPNNENDVNAIGVYNFENQKIGYIPRYYCKGVLQLFEDGRKVQCFVNNVDKDKSCHECISLDLVVSK
ncbi:MAG: HIRAN domain-containing protein [Mobilitalea sp.]